jgi:hypothetical protein
MQNAKRIKSDPNADWIRIKEGYQYIGALPEGWLLRIVYDGESFSGYPMYRIWFKSPKDGVRSRVEVKRRGQLPRTRWSLYTAKGNAEYFILKELQHAL